MDRPAEVRNGEVWNREAFEGGEQKERDANLEQAMALA
jgi:hypothetical protein